MTGVNWSTSGTYLFGVTGAICRNEEFLHPGLNGVYSVVTNSSSLIVSSNLYDQFGFLRNASGLANSLIRYGFNAEEGINNLRYLFTQVQTNQVRQQQQKKDDEHCERRYQRCKDAADKAYMRRYHWHSVGCSDSAAGRATWHSQPLLWQSPAHPNWF